MVFPVRGVVVVDIVVEDEWVVRWRVTMATVKRVLVLAMLARAV